MRYTLVELVNQHRDHVSYTLNKIMQPMTIIMSYYASLIPVNFFTYASLFSVTALCADRFLAIYLHLRYQELVTYKRVAAVVVSIWVISALISLIRLFLKKKMSCTYVSFVIIISRGLYYNCNFTERQALSNSKTPHKPNSRPASSAEWPRRKC